MSVPASLSGFAPGTAWLFPAILIGYEPLILVFGIAGGVLAYRRERAFDSFLVWWAVVGFALLLISDGRHALWSTLVVVPLALLAAISIEALAKMFADVEQRIRLAVFAPIAKSRCRRPFPVTRRTPPSRSTSPPSSGSSRMPVTSASRAPVSMKP